MRRFRLRELTLVSMLAPSVLAAQHEHRPGMHGPADSAAAPGSPLPAQAAFGAISEVVKQLRTDPATDWSKVDLERLRQHLIDMDDVTLRSRVVSVPVPGGVRLDVSADGRARSAVQRLTEAHVHVLAQEGLAGRVDRTATGVRFTVTARNPADSRRVAELRGLGFIGIMTLGDHHATHHLALARGEAPAGH